MARDAKTLEVVARAVEGAQADLDRAANSTSVDLTVYYSQRAVVRLLSAVLAELELLRRTIERSAPPSGFHTTSDL
jgi:hypothetical protein